MLFPDHDFEVAADVLEVVVVFIVDGGVVKADIPRCEFDTMKNNNNVVNIIL
jgi:hypothetical protein